MPAKQRFGAEAAEFVVDLGLVVELELAVDDRLPQLLAERHALFELGLHLRLEEPHPAAARLLRLVHGDVGLLQYIVRRLFAAAEERHPDARARLEQRAVELEGRRQPFQHMRRKGADLHFGCVAVDAEILEEDDELVAAVASHQRCQVAAAP